MGAVCCCFQVDLFESYVNPNSPTSSCFINSFMNLYTSLVNREERRQVIPSSVESSTAMTSTVSLDESFSNTYHSPPRPLPYDADPRCFHLATRHEKGSSHLGEEAELLRSSNETKSEALDGGTKWSNCNSEDCSKEEYSKGSSNIGKSKTISGIQTYYAESDDEDICPTCLDDYNHENPKIITKCCHHFHLSCIYEWMERSETCPVCGKVMTFEETC